MKTFQDILRKIFLATQDKLPKEDKMASSLKHFCLDKNLGFICTKEAGHKGEHIAHGVDGLILVRWQKKEDIKMPIIIDSGVNLLSGMVLVAFLVGLLCGWWVRGR